MFRLTTDPIQVVHQDHLGAGGFVSFEGKVRDHADGREVLRLEYEAYPELAQSEGDKLAREAVERFGLISATIVHRVGVLELGETAVLIQTAAAHRRQAFASCEWIIDQLKFRVPIWKRETYADGDSGWVGADAHGSGPNVDTEYFERQVRLPEVGAEGQLKLSAARVLLVGVGGLGSGSLPYLVAAGIGAIGLVDPDEIELSNLHRQVIYGTDEVGRSKVERAANFARKLRPGITVDVHPVALGSGNVDALVASYDWVVDGTDSLAVKALLNAACRRHRKPLVTASVHRFEGHLMTVLPDGPCLNCLFPTWPADSCVGSCAETGVLGVVPGLFGVLQANEVLKGILGFGEMLGDKLLLLDLRTGGTELISRANRENCLGCAGEMSHDPDPIEIESIAEAKRRFGSYQLVDIRELYEKPDIRLPHVRQPMSRFDSSSLAGNIVLCCAAGVRSFHLAAILRSQGFKSVYSLRGGMDAIESA